LVYLLDVKSKKEEDFLIAKYGINYTEYMEDVPGRFLPADLLADMPWNKKEEDE
jgi:protein-S-isoprenylcysteine O-methyltransferase Ste14